MRQDHARLLQSQNGALRRVEFHRQGDEREEHESRKEDDAGPYEVCALEHEADPCHKRRDVGSNHGGLDHQGSEAERAVVLRVLNRMPRLMGGDTEGSQRTPMEDVRGEAQDLSARVIVIGKKARRLFYSNSRGSSLSNQFPGRFGTGPASLTRDLTVTLERGLNPGACPKTEQDTGNEKCEIQRIEMEHALQPNSAYRFGKGTLVLLTSCLLSCAGGGREANTPENAPQEKTAQQAPPQNKQPEAPVHSQTTPSSKESPQEAAISPGNIPKELPESFPCGEHTCYRFSDARLALVPLLLHEKVQLVAFGEAHAPGGYRGRTTVARFTEDLLPTISDGASHLLVELLLPPDGGCKKEKEHAQKQSDEVTQGQAETNQNEYLTLGKQARKLGVVPEILRSTCDDLKKIAAPDGGVFAMMEIIADHSVKTLGEQLRSTRKGRPLVFAYGGALHNDANPRPGRETWSYGPRMLKDADSSYLEVDLLIPELIGQSESWQGFAWYSAYQALPPSDDAILMKWGEHSYSLFFPREKPPQK